MSSGHSHKSLLDAFQQKPGMADSDLIGKFDAAAKRKGINIKDPKFDLKAFDHVIDAMSKDKGTKADDLSKIQAVRPEVAANNAENVEQSAVDKAIAQMQNGNIAFNHPAEIDTGHTADVALILSPNKTIDAIKADILQANKEAGVVEGHSIKWSPFMEADLVGDGLSVTKIGPSMQAVSGTTDATWNWSIKALESDEDTRKLHLTLNALITIDGKDRPTAVRVFDDTIKVNNPLPTRIRHFFSGNWQWIVTTLLLPLFGWIGKKLFKKRRARHQVRN